jgi:hypothetical protein
MTVVALALLWAIGDQIDRKSAPQAIFSHREYYHGDCKSFIVVEHIADVPAGA